MTTKISLALLALTVATASASAQTRTERVRDVILGRDRVDTRTDARRGGTIGDVIYGRSTEQRTSTKVPKGHLPPRGMCRVWIDGVPPGQQPAVTSCSQAERDRLQYGTGARVIYGDDQAFPGKGKGKFKNAREQDSGTVLDRRGTIRDKRESVINGRVDDDRVGDASDRRGKKGAKAQKGRGKGRQDG